MKHYQAILFDLDGTLLPMDQDAVVSAYFHQWHTMTEVAAMKPAFGNSFPLGKVFRAK